MATWDELKETRLRLRDPSGVIELSHVANDAARPASPARQTAYRSDDTGLYSIYDSDLTIWKVLDLGISDDRLNNLIDLYGVNKAVDKALNFIIAGIYDKMQFVRLETGTESTQYQTLADTVAFYKALKAQYKEDIAEESQTDTGRYFKVTPPTIAGGMEC